MSSGRKDALLGQPLAQMRNKKIVDVLNVQKGAARQVEPLAGIVPQGVIVVCI